METGRNVAPSIIDICGQKIFVRNISWMLLLQQQPKNNFHFGRLAHFYRFGRNIRLMQVDREKNQEETNVSLHF